MYCDRLIIKSPSEKSFKANTRILDEIIKCGKNTGVVLKLVEILHDEKTFIWEASYQEKISYSNMTIAVMKLLFKKGIEPGELLNEVPLVGCEQQLKKFLSILEKADGEKKPEVA